MTETDHTYGRIAAELRDNIVSGHLSPSERLPTEADLSRQFGVSRLTVRRALSVLQEEGLIRRRQGSGTFVSPKPARRIPVMIDYTGSVRNHAPSLGRTVISWKWTEGSTLICDLLQIGEGELVLHAERVDDLNGTPVAWDETYISHSFGDRITDRHLSHVNFLEFWTKTSRFRIESCRQTIEAVPARGRTPALLDIKSGYPVLKSTEVYYTHKSRPAGVFVSYYHPRFISIVSKYDWTNSHHAGSR